jgi:DNA-binding LacI/PurR family transcriptional regulator
MAVDIREVAQRAPSDSTVPRVPNHSGYVSEATRARVLKATEDLVQAEQHRPVPEEQEIQLRGAPVPDVANEFFASLPVP